MNESRIMVAVTEDPYDHTVNITEVFEGRWEYADKVVVITQDEWDVYAKAREMYFMLQEGIASRVGISNIEIQERLK